MDAVAVSEPVLDQVAAHVAVCELLTYFGQRTDYELAHERGGGRPGPTTS